MSAKVAPITEDQAAIKVQAMTRGKMTRANTTSLKASVVATDEGVKKMEAKLFAAKGSDAGGGAAKPKSWKLVKQKTGITFDNWDMALQVVEAGWRGELAREVARQVAAKTPDNPWGKVFLVFIAYWAAFFIFQADMAPPDNPVMPAGFAVVLIWVCSTACGKAMGKIGMPGLLGNLLSGIILKNAIAYPGGTYNYFDAVCPPAPSCDGSGSASASGSGAGRMLAGSVDYSNPQWCVGKSINGLPDGWASDIITFGAPLPAARTRSSGRLSRLWRAHSLRPSPPTCHSLPPALPSHLPLSL